MPKKPSFFDHIKDMVVEDDASTPHEAETPSTPIPSLGFGLGSPGVQAPSAPQTATFTRPLGNELDPAVVQTVEAGVYVDFGGKSSKFLKFVQMWHKLGQPQDPTTVIGALQVFDVTITKQAILDDLAGHFKLLDNTAAQAKTAFDEAAKQQVGGAGDEISALTKANEDANAQISKLQQESSARTARIAQLTTQRADAQAKIDVVVHNTENAVNKVRGDLTSLQQLIARAS